MNNSKIIFFPKNDKKDATGKVPIYCKITVNGTRTTFPTKKYVDPKKWDANKQFRLSRELSEKEIRNYLDNIKRDIERIEEKFQEQGKVYNAEILKNKLLGRGEINMTRSLFQVWDEHEVDFLHQIKTKQRKPDSYKKYKSVKRKLVEFLGDKYELSDIPLNSLDDKFQRSFYTFLLDSISHNIAIKYVVLSGVWSNSLLTEDT